ncbi:MAG: hypothetical protein D3926_04270 [Desulfobacteraceae bacterium]|nr:MAG: hypothetical protein D3926_04270 [Desulfobacteraceae bacterium]
MAYNPEKYREKRERVLGVKKRGMSLNMVMGVVALVIIAGLSVVTVPQAVSYMTTRHLDDVIYRTADHGTWPSRVVVLLESVQGVKSARADSEHTRLVITFDRRIGEPSTFESLMADHGLEVVLLNRVNHRQHQATIKEETELEAL